MFKVTLLLSDCLSQPELRFLNHWDTEERKWEQLEMQEENEDVLGGSKSSSKQHRWKRKENLCFLPQEEKKEEETGKGEG